MLQFQVITVIGTLAAFKDRADAEAYARDKSKSSGMASFTHWVHEVREESSCVQSFHNGKALQDRGL